MKQNRLSIGFKLFALLLCMASFGTWFLQSIHGPLLSIACGAIMYITAAKSHLLLRSRVNEVWVLLLTVATLLTCTGMNINGYIAALIVLFPTYVLFFLKSEYKAELLHFFMKSFGVMIAVSLLWYALFLSGFNLPSFELTRASSDSDVEYHRTVYYLFTIKTDGDILSLLIPRFCFVFYEPGYFGCLMAVLLYLNRFKFDKIHWENFVFLVSLILSLSVAGISVAVFGFIVYSVKNSQHKVRWLLASLALFAAFYFSVVNYNGGDNLINNALFARFEYDQSSGDFAGNTRFSADVSDYFWSKFIHSGNLLFGMKDSDRVLTNNNVDYLSFIIRHGLVAMMILLLFLYYPSLKDRINRYNLFCLAMIYTLVFAQGSFSVLWELNIFIFIMGVNQIQRDCDLRQNRLIG